MERSRWARDLGTRGMTCGECSELSFYLTNPGLGAGEAVTWKHQWVQTEKPPQKPKDKERENEQPSKTENFFDRKQTSKTVTALLQPNGTLHPQHKGTWEAWISTSMCQKPPPQLGDVRGGHVGAPAAAQQ